jgi:segregation and condensation protein B
MAQIVELFMGLEATTTLSQAALETLSIISYKQPITRPQVDSIRGVNSDGVMKTLLSKGLIQEIGRAEGPGRPFLYSTTPEFLGYFGLTSLDELPPLELEMHGSPNNPNNNDILKN